MSLLFPYAPRIHVDEFEDGVYWTIYNVYYTEAGFCSGNCWDDQNDPKSDGDTDEIPYFCGIE